MVELNIQQQEKQQLLNKLITEIIGSKKKSWVPGSDWVQYSGSFMDEREYIAVIETLLNGWLCLAENGIRFENKFPIRLGKEHGCLTNSGSSANLLMVSALTSRKIWDLPKGSKIITPVAGFPTTVNPIIQNGFTPVFIDIEVDTLNLDVMKLEEAAKNGANALMFAHVLGNPPNMDAVMNIVHRYNLILIEDCCDALGSTYDGKMLGSFGEMASCSFYPAHHITMGEGGFIATKTKEQEMLIKSLREWGRGCYCSGKAASCLKNGMCKRRFSNWLPSMPDEVFDHKYVYEEIGYNLKPLDLQAAMGLVQLDKLDDIIAIRKHNYSLLFDVFSKYEEFFHLPRANAKANPAWFAFPLTIKDGAPFKRTDLTMFLEDNKIQTRNYFGGNILLQPGYDRVAPHIDAKKEFPIATKVTKDTFFLGTSPIITKEQIDYIGQVVNRFFKSRNLGKAL
jgi:CDP-6-deoxy-D-xylo-4-hexulose-3-dehydrase